jgi:hypothetical protein
MPLSHHSNTPPVAKPAPSQSSVFWSPPNQHPVVSNPKGSAESSVGSDLGRSTVSTSEVPSSLRDGENHPPGFGDYSSQYLLAHDWCDLSRTLLTVVHDKATFIAVASALGLTTLQAKLLWDLYELDHALGP